MGKTPKPLKIAYHPSLEDSAELQALAKKGHLVVPMQTYDECDLVLGPNCWRMTPELLQYLDLAIKGARGVKYPKKGKV